jgi:hypothetical protein
LPWNSGSGSVTDFSSDSYKRVLLLVGLLMAGGKMFDFLFDDDWGEEWTEKAIRSAS